MNKNLLQIHAKSFYWASFFLSKKIFYQCSVLYNFCRTLDDIVDSEKQLEIRKKEFSNFKNDFLNKNLNNQIIKEMWDLINSQNISKIVVLDLFDGVETDLKKSLKIISKKDLLVYSYRVAGTVGLMMSKILNVKNDEALLGAIDLGIAMQLTNIARDVVEDKKRNREYINHDFSSIKQTILEAENFYNISFKAIKSIPIRSRFSVIVARRIYRKIGHHIIKRENIENYNKSGKIFVPTYGKIIESFLSIIDFFTLLFSQNNKYNNEKHELLSKEINLNERI
jgi:phytoene synthase